MARQPADRFKTDRPQLTIRPLTPDLWPALEDLFGPNGAVSGCWCMYWRLGSGYAKREATKNRSDFRKRVNDGQKGNGRPPGLLAFARDDRNAKNRGDEIAVGWCQVTPRRELTWLDQKSKVKHDDGDTAMNEAIWSVSCFYIRKGWRKKGVMTALIEAAVKAARKAGAPALEAYPLNPGKTPSASYTGYTTSFRRAGFKTVAKPGAARETMRLALKKPA